MDRKEFEKYISNNHRLNQDAVDYVFLRTDVLPNFPYNNINSDSFAEAEKSLDFESEEFARFCLISFKTMPYYLVQKAIANEDKKIRKITDYFDVLLKVNVNPVEFIMKLDNDLKAYFKYNMPSLFDYVYNNFKTQMFEYFKDDFDIYKTFGFIYYLLDKHFEEINVEFKDILIKNILQSEGTITNYFYFLFKSFKEDNDNQMLIKTLFKQLFRINKIKKEFFIDIENYLNNKTISKNFETTIKKIKDIYADYIKEFAKTIYSSQFKNIDFYHNAILLLKKINNNKVISIALKDIQKDEKVLTYFDMNENDLHKYIVECGETKDFADLYDTKPSTVFEILKTIDDPYILNSRISYLITKNRIQTYPIVLKFLENVNDQYTMAYCVDYLKEYKTCYDDVKKHLDSKKSFIKETVIQMLLHFDKEEDFDLLKELNEKETNKRISKLLADYFVNKSKTTNDNKSVLTNNDLLNVAKKLKKDFTVIFTEYPRLLLKNKTEADNLLFNLLLTTLYKTKDYVVNVEGEQMLLNFDIDSIKTFVDYGLSVKRSDEVIYKLLSYCGDDSYISRLKEEIESLIKVSRGAAAAKLCYTIAKFKTPKAFQTLDFLSQKAKDGRVKTASKFAIDNAAKEMKMSKEEFLDYIIPDFGFSQEGKSELNFGKRKFFVFINPELELIIKDENNKEIKTLPKASKDDDELLVKTATDLLKNIKKEMKNQVKIEKERLEKSFVAERLWKVKNWVELFTKNPFMKRFAIGLIWGIYENNKLIKSFRFNEDGTFNDINDNSFKLPEKCFITLIHPIDLTEEDKNKWIQQLKDYEIIQPLNQFNRIITYITEGEKEVDCFLDCQGYMVTRGKLKGLMNLGWEKGYIEDAGCYYFYSKTYPSDYTLKLNFLGDYIGNTSELGKEVPIYDIQVSKGKQKIRLYEIPKRLFSEIKIELKNILDSSSGYNENWKKAKW